MVALVVLKKGKMGQMCWCSFSPHGLGIVVARLRFSGTARATEACYPSGDLKGNRVAVWTSGCKVSK